MIGTTVHNYLVVDKIGEGGMGTVYRARHPVIGRDAAIKVLHPDLVRKKILVTRFFNEARAAHAIRHPNIVEVIDVGYLPDGETPYLMMEHLEGETLAQRLRHGRLDIGDALDVAIEVAEALAAAHQAGVIHRDLKPENLFLVPRPDLPRGETLKIVDFGVAKLHDDLRGDEARTATGMLLGTPKYMSPEQCRGAGVPIDHRSDIYSLGVILFHTLCERPPFLAQGLGDILIMHVTQPPPSPRSLNPEITPALEAVLLKMLAKNPEARHSGMEEVVADLQRCRTATPHSAVRAAATAPIDHTRGDTLGATIVDAVPPRETLLLEPATVGTSSPQLPGLETTTMSGSASQMAARSVATSWNRRVIVSGLGLGSIALLAAAAVVKSKQALPPADDPASGHRAIAPAPPPPAPLPMPTPLPALANPDAGSSDAEGSETAPPVVAPEPRRRPKAW